MTAVAANELVTDVQLANYAKLIYEVAGIKISPQKKMLLSNRIRRRLRATGIDTFEAYFKKLTAIPVANPEWDCFLQEITTHETYLFRDEGQWNWFRKDYLGELVAKTNQGQRRKELRIWSAACSTGDEAYTIASCIADRIKNSAQWNISIVGTDIGIGAVEEANTAVFGKRAMAKVPESYRRRFFSKQGTEELWAAKEPLTRWTQFRTHNLLNPLRDQPFDLIFLKNVLIYFDADSKRAALKHLHTRLKPGGSLVTGPAEGVGGMLDNFERISSWLHLKPTIAGIRG